jgi:hypothetical protein
VGEIPYSISSLLVRIHHKVKKKKKKGISLLTDAKRFV